MPGPAEIRTRRLEPDDYDIWYPLWQAYLRFYESALPDDVTRTSFARLTSPDGPMHGFLALDRSGSAIGLVHWLTHPATWSTGDYCYLEDLYVATEARGTGAGRALIEAVYAAAHEHGASQVYWLTHETNRVAQDLYDRIAVRTGFIHYRQRM